MVFALSPLCSASIIFTNSVLGKMYMTINYRFVNPDGPDPAKDKVFANTHKAQLNEAEWSPMLIGGLICLHLKGDKQPTIAAGLAAFGSIYYLWCRIFCVAKNAGITLPGGASRYLAAAMISLQLMKMVKCPVLKLK